MKLKPLSDYILFKPFPRQDSDILFVVNRTQRMYKGEVFRVGPGRFDETRADGTLRKLPYRKVLGVEPGDIVNVGETPVKFPTWNEDGNTYWIIQEADIAFIEQTIP